MISVLALVPLMWMASIFSELDDGIVGSTTSLALQILLGIGPLMFAADAIMIGRSSAQDGSDPAVAISRTAHQATRPTPVARMPGIVLYKAFLTAALWSLGLLIALVVAFLIWWIGSGASDCFLGC